MTELGEKKLIKKKAANRSYIWHACEICGKERWVRLRGNEPLSQMCRACVGRSNRGKSWKSFSHWQTCLGTIENPVDGDIRHGREIGKKRSQRSALFQWRPCETCELKSWVRVIRRRVAPKCSKCGRNSPRGVASPHWKGGKGQNIQGYMVVTLPEESFYIKMAGKRGRILEHRLIMAENL